MYKKIVNWFNLLALNIVIIIRNRGKTSVNLLNKGLHKRPKLIILRVGALGKLSAACIISKKANHANVAFIDFMWKRKLNKSLPEEREILLLSRTYELAVELIRTVEPQIDKIAIPLDVRDSFTIERMRKLMTINGFLPDDSLTLEDITFSTPYREQETLKNVVYSRFYT